MITSPFELKSFFGPVQIELIDVPGKRFQWNVMPGVLWANNRFRSCYIVHGLNSPRLLFMASVGVNYTEPQLRAINRVYRSWPSFI